jgi:hypothetical protein
MYVETLCHAPGINQLNCYTMETLSYCHKRAPANHRSQQQIFFFPKSAARQAKLAPLFADRENSGVAVPMAVATARRRLPFRFRDKTGDARNSREIPCGSATQWAAPTTAHLGGQRAGARSHAFLLRRRGFRLSRERVAFRNGARRHPQSPLLTDNFA